MKSTPIQMSVDAVPPTRLTELLVDKSAARLSPLEQQAAALLAKLPTPTPLSPQSIERIGKTIVRPPASSLGWLIGGGTGLAVVVVAATALWPRPSGPPPVRPNVVESDRSAPQIRPVEPTQPVSVPPVPAKTLATAPPHTAGEPTSPSTHPARKHVVAAVVKPAVGVAVPSTSLTVPVPSVDPPTEESALALESRLLGLALRELRQTHDAKQALVRLDEYSARFPSGLLKVEAQAARVDALMLLGRRDEALGLLEHTTFTRLPRGGELTVLRGELRAASGRCREALSDFAASGDSGSTAEVAERGLYGQGMCRAHLGDLAGAESDLRAYLARFPAGRFRASAQATLRNLTATP